jgi:hypothetical protein
MYGTWFLLTFGLTAGLVLLIGALALSAWSPLFAVLAFVVIGAVLLALASFRRSSEYVDEDDSAGQARRPDPADVAVTDPDRRGAPVGGASTSEPTSVPPSPGAPTR